MSSIASLTTRINRMKAQLVPVNVPKQWVILCEPGQELPDGIRSQVGPYDHILIQEVPAGWLDDSEFPKVACTYPLTRLRKR